MESNKARSSTEVVLYTRRGCHLCDDARAALEELRDQHPHTLRTIDIDADPSLRQRYGWVVPVVVIDRRYRLVTRLTPAMLAAALGRAQEERRPPSPAD